MWTTAGNFGGAPAIRRRRGDSRAYVGQDIIGLKVRVLGDAVFAPDQLLPQIAVGAQWKRTLDFEQIPHAVGAARGEDVDLYIAATKVYFAAIAGRNVIIDATLRRTRANQFGLLGFGGDGGDYRWTPEVSAAVWLERRRSARRGISDKPDDLRAFRENSARDCSSPGRRENVAFTAAWTDLGRIAGKSEHAGCICRCGRAISGARVGWIRSGCRATRAH